MLLPLIMKHKLRKDRETHGVAIFDPHFPYEDRQSFAAVLQYISDTRPDIVVIGGDVVDLDLISDKSKSRHVEGKRLKKQCDYASEMLVAIRQWCDWMYVLEGNHDERMERYIDDHPEVEGILEIPTMLRLAENDIQWVPSWRKGEVLTIGKANFIHGYTESKHHAAKTADDYGVNMLYGHCHDIQSHSKVLHGDDSTIMAQCCGCLCRYDMPYLRGKPTKWQQAFVDIWWRPNGQFWHQVIPIFNHRFLAQGREYGPS